MPLTQEDWNPVQTLLQDALSRLDVKVRSLFPHTGSREDIYRSPEFPLAVSRIFSERLIVSIAFEQGDSVLYLEASLIEVATSIKFPEKYTLVNPSPSDVLQAARRIASIVESWTGRIVSLLPEPGVPEEEPESSQEESLGSDNEKSHVEPADLWKHEEDCDGTCNIPACAAPKQLKVDRMAHLQRYREIAFTALCQANSRVESPETAEKLAHQMLDAERNTLS